MDLRYRLAVVTGAGGGLGREISVALSRRGAAVLVIDHDLAAAAETASLIRAARVKAWAFQGDITEEADLQMMAARARDLGGMDLLVSQPFGHPVSQAVGRDILDPLADLTQLFVDGLAQRRGRRDGTPAVVHVGPDRDAEAATGLVHFVMSLANSASTGGARVMAVVPTRIDETAAVEINETTAITTAVVDLLCHGTAGQVLEVATGSGSPTARA